MRLRKNIDVLYCQVITITQPNTKNKYVTNNVLNNNSFVNLIINERTTENRHNLNHNFIITSVCLKEFTRMTELTKQIIIFYNYDHNYKIM